MSADADRISMDDARVIARLRRVAQARIEERRRREAETWIPPSAGDAPGDGGVRDDGE